MASLRELKSNSKSKRLLITGYDMVLLQSRASILKRMGLDVSTVGQPGIFEEASQKLVDAFDLLVICHTVPCKERVVIASMAAQWSVPCFQIEGMILPERLMLEVILRLAQQPPVAALTAGAPIAITSRRVSLPRPEAQKC